MSKSPTPEPTNLFARLIDGWSDLTGYASGLAIFAASAIIVDMVVVRKMFHQSTSWQEELARYLLILATFIGAAFTQKREGHIGIDLVTYYVPAKPRQVIHIVGAVAGFIVAVLIARYAWPVWWNTILYNEHSETLWGPHLGFPYILMPLGMTFLALQYLVYIGKKITLLKTSSRGQSPAAPPEPPCSYEPPSEAATDGKGGQGK